MRITHRELPPDTLKELAQEALELDDLVRLEPREELALACGVGGDCGIDDRETLVRELDDHAAPIIRIRQPPDEPAPLEPINPARHACRREQEAACKARRG